MKKLLFILLITCCLLSFHVIKATNRTNTTSSNAKMQKQYWYFACTQCKSEKKKEASFQFPADQFDKPYVAHFISNHLWWEHDYHKLWIYNERGHFMYDKNREKFIKKLSPKECAALVQLVVAQEKEMFVAAKY